MTEDQVGNYTQHRSSRACSSADCINLTGIKKLQHGDIEVGGKGGKGEGGELGCDLEEIILTAKPASNHHEFLP